MQKPGPKIVSSHDPTREIPFISLQMSVHIYTTLFWLKKTMSSDRRVYALGLNVQRILEVVEVRHLLGLGVDVPKAPTDDTVRDTVSRMTYFGGICGYRRL
ncbi:hypothetical protein JTE90_019304 [Oedothorax gibbosus]|uniref:Uncharacterized protein n=1 Tax=Oedothorax gibbosus TaxID=931172 RepID=A0AAV6UX78_9ARAC|nr:hypothetical protein JTE90_019304 [Oedothorax gibbosus]